MTARILIIDDDEASRELAKYLLESRGYSTLGAEDGRMGVQLTETAQPDLILCDLQMPVMNGYEVVRYLRASSLWRRVPLIAVTAFSMSGDRESALKAGFDDHVTKPIDPETFVAQVEAFLPSELRVQPFPTS
ncbi:MAG: two-component system response regulator [Burkholderiales bacterium RIFCSPLOWO2_12_FULL_61_40]|nr:MAG: two-component system response regulator [Burkholderiales bacterium RIFCSPLOWO2_12_FULL_61_40]